MNDSKSLEGAEGIRVIDERKKPFFMVDKSVVWNWLPFIGVDGYVLYSIYLSLVNRDKGCAFPSLNQIARFLKRGKSTIVKYNKVLEECGLIRIDRKLNGYGAYVANNYYILDVPDVPENLAPELTERSFIVEAKTKNLVKINPEGGGHVQDKGVTDKTRGGHTQDKGGHVQDSNKNNSNKNNIEKLSLSERDLEIHENSIFAFIPKPILHKLAEKHSVEEVNNAINSLDHTYRGKKKEVCSPLALLKTALDEGYEPVKTDIPNRTVPSQQETLPGTEANEKWDQIIQAYNSLPTGIRKSWEDFQNQLCKKMSMQAFETWFAQVIPIQIENEKMTVHVQSQTIQEFIERKWQSQIDGMLKNGAFAFKAIRLVI